MVRHRVVPGALVALLLLAASAALIAARRPDVVIRPQFWAEDGMVWYASAHNDPSWLDSILAPYGGYLQLFPRLAGLVVQPVDLARAPLLMNVLALLIQAMAPAFFLSDRFARVVPGRARRLVLSLVLVAVPNMMEIHANVTNSQVHLALLAFLVLIAAPAPSAAWRIFDVICLLVSGLSGPFCILLLPVAGLCWLRDRARWSLVRLALVVAVASVQIVILRQVGAESRLGPLLPAHGASVAGLLDLLGRQIFVAGLAGLWRYVGLNVGTFADHPWLPIVIGAAGLVFVARALLVTSSFALRVFVLFAALHLAGALASPIIFGDKPLWELLKLPSAGQRYYFFATLAFLATLFWTVAADPRRAVRGVAAALLAVLVLVGIRGDWRLPPHPDLDFAAQAARFAAAPPGEKVSLRIMPEPWTMVLVKH